MNLTDFVEDLEAQGVELSVHEDRLRYRGRQDLLTPEVIAQLKERKEEILALQRERTQHSRLSPLSHGQSALWFLSELAPTSFAYHVGFAAEIYSHVNIPALQRALQKMAERHAGLRTTFRKRNGIPVQEIHSNLLPDFEAIHLASTDGATLRTKVIEAYKCPFDLERGPLPRVRLFTCTPEYHVLLLTVHHLVCDAWSLWLLLNELGVAYRAESDGATVALPPLGADYTDFVRWQRELIAAEEGERLWAYWKQQLGGELPVLNLATDRPRPPVQTFNGGSVNFGLGPPVTARLRAFAAAEGTTLYMTLFATFAVLIHRYTGQDEVLLGSPTSGRTERQFADILGDFINTVVVRSSMPDDPSFRAYLDRFSKVTLEAIAHERFPFSLLVERLRVGRDPSRSPLFQVLFNFLKPQKFQDVIELWVSGETGDRVEWGGLSLGPFALPQQEGQVDLALEMIEGKTSLLGILKYNTDLFDSATIERMAGHFETLLERILVDPDQPLSRVSLLTEAERHQLLIEWNSTHADFPRDQCVHQLFEAQAARTPHSTAVVSENRSLTYSQLNAQADALATGLRLLGVGPNVLVGLCTERSLGMMVGLLGILKAGGTYVPLDPDNPHSRVDFILQDAGISLLVTQKSVISKMQFKGQPVPGAASVADLMVLRMTDAQTLESTQRAASTADAVAPHHMAYVIYTSGSTGKPKGVQICHRSVVNFIASMSKEPGLSPGETIVALTPLSFDIAVLELIMPLAVGGRVVIAPREVAVDPEQLAVLIRQSAAHVVQATPATWRLLVEWGWPGEPSLKILIGGEPLPAQLAGQLLSRCSSLWNMYGPTETTVWSSISRVISADSISIGKPIANTQLYVLQPGNQLAPVGIPGELCIGGEGLARGYWNRPDLTEKAFVPNPFSEENGARLYRTGDLVRRRAGGGIEFLGRIDHQVKIRGYRVELGEVEETLRQYPKVKDAVVTVWERVPGDKRLAAYIVSATSETVSSEELRNYVASKLPEYMVPSSFITVEVFPLNTSGKVDRRALPTPSQELPERDISAPSRKTATQEVLLDIWSQLLGLGRVDLDDNLFHLGGHSLIAVHLVGLVQRRLHVKLAVKDVFTYPTIRSLSSIIDSQIAGDENPPASVPSFAPDSSKTSEPLGSAGSAHQNLREKLGAGTESLFRGLFNRILQFAARVAPGVLRSVFHRWRGVGMGTNVLIGYDAIIETAYPPQVSIGNNTSIGMRVTIIGHFSPMETTRKSKDVTVKICDEVWIGPGSLILPNVTIGKGSVVAAGSVVSQSVPPSTMVQGNPARPIARCPVPLKRGVIFEEFLKNLLPLD